MAWQVLLEITDCASHAAIPYATVTDGTSSASTDGAGRLLATIYEDNVFGWGLQISAANYKAKHVDVLHSEAGKKIPVCLDHAAPSAPTGEGPYVGGW